MNHFSILGRVVLILGFLLVSCGVCDLEGRQVPAGMGCEESCPNLGTQPVPMEQVVSPVTLAEQDAQRALEKERQALEREQRRAKQRERELSSQAREELEGLRKASTLARDSAVSVLREQLKLQERESKAAHAALAQARAEQAERVSAAECGLGHVSPGHRYAR